MTSKVLNTVTRKELLALPLRPWNESTIYESILVFPANRLHESGWQNQVLVGCKSATPIDLISTAVDDIHWINFIDLRTDCTAKSRCFHFWSKTNLFEVKHTLSSTYIYARTIA